MPEISFNSKALGIARHGADCDMSHAQFTGTSVPIMVRNPDIKPLMERLGFTNIKCLPFFRRKSPAKDIDP